jgi:hypothetical protein
MQSGSVTPIENEEAKIEAHPISDEKALLKLHFSNIVYCPIANCEEVIRHPVLLSDGQHYEMSVIYKWFKESKELKSPFNRSLVTSAVYDIQLKNILDQIVGDDTRYPDYDQAKVYKKLQDRISPPIKKPNQYGFFSCRYWENFASRYSEKILLLIFITYYWVDDINASQFSGSYCF